MGNIDGKRAQQRRIAPQSPTPAPDNPAFMMAPPYSDQPLATPQEASAGEKAALHIVIPVTAVARLPTCSARPGTGRNGMRRADVIFT